MEIAYALKLRNSLRRSRRKGSKGSHARMLAQHRHFHSDKAPGGYWCPGALERGHEAHPIDREREWLTVDHIVPVSAGGSNGRDNKRVLCSTENHAKAAVIPRGRNLELAQRTRMPTQAEERAAQAIYRRLKYE